MSTETGTPNSHRIAVLMISTPVCSFDRRRTRRCADRLDNSNASGGRWLRFELVGKTGRDRLVIAAPQKAATRSPGGGLRVAIGHLVVEGRVVAVPDACVDNGRL